MQLCDDSMEYAAPYHILLLTTGCVLVFMSREIVGRGSWAGGGPASLTFFAQSKYRNTLKMANKVIDEGALASSRLDFFFETCVPQMLSSLRATTRLGICELRPH